MLNSTLMVANNSRLVSTQYFTLTLASTVNLSDSSLDAQSVLLYGSKSKMLLVSSRLRVVAFSINDGATVEIVDCAAVLSPLVLLNATLIGRGGTAMTAKGTQAGSLFLLQNSSAIAEGLAVLGPNGTVELQDTSVLLVRDILVRESRVSAYQSSVLLPGTLQLYSNSTMALVGSRLQSDGGILCENSRFGTLFSKVTTGNTSDFTFLCNLADEPQKTADSPVRAQCELILTYSTLNLAGQFKISGRWSRISILNSTGTIGKANAPQDFRTCCGAGIFISNSSLLISGSMVLANGSSLFARNSSIDLASVMYIDDGSKVVIGEKTTIFIRGRLLLGGGSAVTINNCSVLSISSNLYAANGFLTATNGGEFAFDGGKVSLVDGSIMTLGPGGVLSGAGRINGTLINNGGTIRSKDGNTTDIFIDNYNSSSSGNSTIISVIGQGNNGSLISSTTITTNNATLGGTIQIVVSEGLNQQLLSDGTLIVDGGILLISGQNVSGDLPLLIVQIGNTGETGRLSADAATGCGYRLARTTVSLALVFDSIGCPSMTSGLPSSSSAAQSNFIGPLPLWGFVLVVVGGVVVLAAIVAATIWFVPPLRKRIIPGAALKFSRPRRVARGTSL